ncbi:hypothetical protein HMPREF0080_01662 [Anaeroglobus geminatus F0357]|uniref:Uncharacterized protein n=1 Tax=Anaeroglobus geminatus F0357 TaxID=861450 RepID=G9YJ18_9FIRM|nr:hypothetical protein HMPREF0080_01662 [Anaeroglobus geminatus F0357]
MPFQCLSAGKIDRTDIPAFPDNYSNMLRITAKRLPYSVNIPL